MKPEYYIWLLAFLPLFVVFIQQRKKKKAILKRIVTAKRKGNPGEMVELAKKVYR